MFGFSVFACQKALHFEDDTSTGGNANPGNPAGAEFYMRAKIDGDSRNFNSSNAALLSDLGTGGKNLTFVGLAAPASTSLEGLHMSVYFLNGKPHTGVFQQDDHTAEYVVTGDYNPNSTLVGYFAGLHSVSVAPLKITITSITSQAVKGNFNGAFYKKDLNTGPTTTDEYLLFTDGEFNLPIK